MSKIGQRIKKHRLALDWSLQRLADKAGIDLTYLWRIETGEQKGNNISWGVLKGLADALELSLSELTGHADMSSPDAAGQSLSKEEKRILKAFNRAPDDDPRRIAALALIGLDNMIPKPRPIKPGRPRKS